MNSPREALLELIRRSDSRTVVSLVEGLLQLIRIPENMLLLDAALSSTAQMRFLDAVQEDIRAYFDEFGDEVLNTSDVAKLLAVAPEADDAQALVVARAMALALDTVFGPTFALSFKHRGSLQLTPGRAFPVQEPPLKQLLGKNLNTNPKHLELGLDAVQHLRLAPEQLAPFNITLDWSDDGLLAPLKEGAAMSIAATNASLRDFRWAQFERDGQILFFEVTPKNEEQQTRILIELLEKAEKAGTRLLVFPELCLTNALIEVVRKWFRASTRQLCLLVAGSAHVEVEGRRLNRSVMFLQGGPEYTHDKMRPFAFGDPLRTEDISTSPKRVTLHMSGAWSFVSLICKDFITRELVNLLAELRASLVFVSAMTPKADAFQDFAHQLATQAQSMVLIANIPEVPPPTPPQAPSSGAGASSVQQGSNQGAAVVAAAGSTAQSIETTAHLGAPYALLALPRRGTKISFPPHSPPCLLTVRLSPDAQLTEILTVT
ncbi:nitrilase-related carbon-nitrogen hydrolase [Myxococcus sp. Y35]|uniref:nitrilase-related carbon-nitrogen hydrolase n=1 Tax=Pseudomyxococcus flavus TaxID=3115648 RepID=UPI003CEE4CFD